MAVILKTALSCFRASVLLLPSVMRVVIWVRLRKACVRSVAACVSASSDDIISNGRVSGNKSVLLKTHSLAVLGVYDVR